MSRPRVLLCESDSALASILMAFFSDEHIDVSVCTSLEEIQVALDAHPSAVVVSDSWIHGSRGQISSREIDEIVTLGKVARVILTTGRLWPTRRSGFSLGERVVLIPKPYDVDQLLAAIRVAATDPAS